MNALGIACLQLMANLAGWHVLPPPMMTVVVVAVLVKRMIKECGGAMPLVCSQTLNGCDVHGCFSEPALLNIESLVGDFW